MENAKFIFNRYLNNLKPENILSVFLDDGVFDIRKTQNGFEIVDADDIDENPTEVDINNSEDLDDFIDENTAWLTRKNLRKITYTVLYGKPIVLWNKFNPVKRGRDEIDVDDISDLLSKKGKISFDTKNDNYKTFDLSRGFINKTISDVEKEYNNNKNSKFLIIFSYNNMLRPYYSSEFGISINYIILDENLKEIENYISNDDIEEMKEELRQAMKEIKEKIRQEIK